MPSFSYSGSGSGGIASAKSITLTSADKPLFTITPTLVTARIYCKGSTSAYASNVLHVQIGDFHTWNAVTFSSNNYEYKELSFYMDDAAQFPYASVSSMSVWMEASGGYASSAYISGTHYLVVEYEPTNCSAPTSVSVSSNNVAPSTNVTLSWSGAKAGTSNNIKGYKVYRATSATGTYSLLKTVTTSATSGSCTVTSHASNNTSYYYKVLTISDVSATYNSSMSSVYATLTTKYTVPSAPTKVNAPSQAVIGDSISISWSGAKAGTNNAITGYKLYRAINEGSYSVLATLIAGVTSYTDTAGNTANQVYKYKVVTTGTLSDSGDSSVVSVQIVNLPSVPVVNAPTVDSVTYNPNPRLLVTVSASGSVSGLSVACFGYSGSRTTNLNSGAKIALRRSNTLSGETTESVTVANTDTFGHSASASGSVHYTPAYFTDDPAVSGTTHIKAQHLNEIRQMVNNVRVYYGMGSHNWAEEIIANQTSTLHWAAHVLEIQNQILEVVQFVNSWDSTNTVNDITLPKFTVPSVPKASVLKELRDAIKLL